VGPTVLQCRIDHIGLMSLFKVGNVKIRHYASNPCCEKNVLWYLRTGDDTCQYSQIVE
jgi:hypothetical protein